MSIASPDRSFAKGAPIDAYVFHPAARVQTSFSRQANAVFSIFSVP